MTGEDRQEPSRHVFEFQRVDDERGRSWELLGVTVVLGLMLNMVASLWFAQMFDKGQDFTGQLRTWAVASLMLVALVLEFFVFRRHAMYSHFAIPIVRMADLATTNKWIPLPINRSATPWHFMAQVKALLYTYANEGPDVSEWLRSGARSTPWLGFAGLLPEAVIAVAFDYYRLWTSARWQGAGTAATWYKMAGTSLRFGRPPRNEGRVVTENDLKVVEQNRCLRFLDHDSKGEFMLPPGGVVQLGRDFFHVRVHGWHLSVCVEGSGGASFGSVPFKSIRYAEPQDLWVNHLYVKVEATFKEHLWSPLSDRLTHRDALDYYLWARAFLEAMEDFLKWPLQFDTVADDDNAPAAGRPASG